MLSMIFLLLLLPLLPIILFLYFRKHTITKNDNLQRPPPGPPGLPLIGNLHQFDGEFPHKYLHGLSTHYGPILSLNLGFRPLVVVSSPDLVTEIITKSDLAFSGRPRLTSLQRLSYNGLDIAFSPYNETWREMRKIATLHLLGGKQLRCFHPICKDEVSRMIGKMVRDASLSATTNLSETMVSFANNTICRVAFGKSYGDEGYGKNRFYDILHETQAVMGGFYVKDYFPLLGWIDEVSGMNAKLEKNFRDLDSFYEELIDEHLNRDRPTSMEGDIVDLLLALQTDGSSSSFHLTLDHIKALLMNIITGGTDTVSATLVWAMTALMKKPSIMKKVQSEIRQLEEKKDLIDEEDAAKLPYLKAVIKETLRLYLPAPLLVPRETIQKCSLGGYEIESGTMVYLNAWAIGRDPKTWENANEFLPERFLERDVDVRGRDAEVIPFGIGRRGCPGIAIGMSEVEVVLANVLYKFDWGLPAGVEDVDFDVLPGMTMHKKNPLCLVPNLVVVA